MKRHHSGRTGLSAFLAAAASALLAALIGAALVVATLLVAASFALASAEDSAEGETAHGGASAANVLEEGLLHNTVHGFHFPVPKGFELRSSSTADEIVLEVPGCGECVLRVLVSPGNTDSLDTTVRALKKQVASDPTAKVLDEQRIKVAREPAYTLVKEEAPEAPAPVQGSAQAPAAGPRMLTRYVTFNRGEDKFYFVLREPADRFGQDEDAFDHLLSKLRFDQ